MMNVTLRRPGLFRKALLSFTHKSAGRDVQFFSNRRLGILSPVMSDARFYSSHSAIVAVSSHVPTDSLAWYNPVQYIMDVAHMVHDITGWPYAGVIVCVTAMGRFCLFPLMISSRRVDVKREKVEADLKRFIKAKPSNSALKAKVKALRQKYGYHPSQKLTLPLASIALTAYMFFGLRWMGYYYPVELSTGGILWFVDLTQEDPLYLLPILSGTTSLLMFEVGADFRGQNVTPRRKLFGRCLALTFIPILMFSPASVHIFWTSNWLISSLQDVFISQPAVRNKLGIQKTDELTTPVIFIKDVTKGEAIQEKGGEEASADTIVFNRKVYKGPRNKAKKRR